MTVVVYKSLFSKGMATASAARALRAKAVEYFIFDKVFYLCVDISQEEDQSVKECGVSECAQSTSDECASASISSKLTDGGTGVLCFESGLLHRASEI